MIDSPRSGKEILNENCFSYNTLTGANPMEKDQSLTAYEIVLHDHNYENTPQNTKKNLDNLKIKLISIVKENKALKQRVVRLRKRVETFIECSKRPKTKKIFTRFCVILLSAHEDASLKLFSRMLRNKNSRGKFIRDKYPPYSPICSAVEC
ncbi:uncharacterized protein LOC117215694 [Bombus bifarius]|uniref:Uncharacterized protein LOC117215694 n=1 Tax=Bombus bifarius TaxID=103933 RepID=A0A6P8NCD4_9HYME|nr:uncharacterized protein LOC117215694 [Bombus bifarius]